MATPRPSTRSASIPSKHIGRTDSGSNLLQRSLVVRKLNKTSDSSHSVKQEEDKFLQTPNVTIPTTHDLNELRRTIQNTLQNTNCNQRSFDLLLRLLNNGARPHEGPSEDEMKKENEKTPKSRPITPTPSLNEEDLNFERELTGGDFSELFSDVVYQSPRTIVYERSKSAKSVNSIIAKERQLQRFNLRSRRRNDRKQQVIPSLTSSVSLPADESNINYTTFSSSMPRDISDNWLTLSGRKIKLKHQSHVVRALNGKPEYLPTSKSALSVDNCFIGSNRKRPERNIKSAPLSQSTSATVGIKGGKWAWGNTRRTEGNNFVTHRVKKQLDRKKDVIDFSASLHTGSFSNHAEPHAIPSPLVNDHVVARDDKPPGPQQRLSPTSAYQRKRHDVPKESNMGTRKPQQRTTNDMKITPQNSAYSVVSQLDERNVKSIIIHLPNSSPKHKVSFDPKTNERITEKPNNSQPSPAELPTENIVNTKAESDAKLEALRLLTRHHGKTSLNTIS